MNKDDIIIRKVIIHILDSAEGCRYFQTGAGVWSTAL